MRADSYPLDAAQASLAMGPLRWRIQNKRSHLSPARARHRAGGREALSRRRLARGAARHRNETLTRTYAALGQPDATLALHCDVADPAAVTRAFAAAAQRFSRLDALVNNAGIAVFKPLLETTLDDWQRTLAVNLTGAFLCVQAAAPQMREAGGGAIVNVTSISGFRASTLRVAYGTSKAALAHLTKQQAAELAALSIRVNAVAPGPVDTAMAKKVHTPAIRADYHDAIPLNRYGLEEELAEAIVFLCSERASYITGQTLAVDGGFESTGIGLATLRGEGRNG